MPPALLEMVHIQVEPRHMFAAATTLSCSDLTIRFTDGDSEQRPAASAKLQQGSARRQRVLHDSSSDDDAFA